MQQRLFNRPFKEYLISFSLFFSFILYHSMRNKKKEGLTMEYIVIIPALNPEHAWKNWWTGFGSWKTRF